MNWQEWVGLFLIFGCYCPLINTIRMSTMHKVVSLLVAVVFMSTLVLADGPKKDVKDAKKEVKEAKADLKNAKAEAKTEAKAGNKESAKATVKAARKEVKAAKKELKQARQAVKEEKAK